MNDTIRTSPPFACSCRNSIKYRLFTSQQFSSLLGKCLQVDDSFMSRSSEGGCFLPAQCSSSLGCLKRLVLSFLRLFLERQLPFFTVRNTLGLQELRDLEKAVGGFVMSSYRIPMRLFWQIFVFFACLMTFQNCLGYTATNDGMICDW